MNYNFPDMNHISDVVPHIEDRQEFKVMVKDWYTVINYMVAFEDTFPSVNVAGGSSKMRFARSFENAIRRECRGLIFDTATGQLISRPYHKFFNAGERDETQLDKINLSEPHVVLEKLDGSMIRPIPTVEGFRLATKAGVTDVAMNAEVFIADKPHYAQFINKCIQKGTTPIFEWCSRKNRIVIDYPKDSLVLTAMRLVDTGNYVSYKTMKQYAEAWIIPVVKAIAGDATDITKVVEHIRKWDDGEGVVIRFDDGHMVKIKADDYVLRHKSKDAINQEKNVIETIISDAVDDLIPLLTPEDANRVRKFEKAFWLAVEDVGTTLHDTYQSIPKGKDQKDFALNVSAGIPKYQQSFMFNLHRGVPVRDLLVNSIGKSLSTQTKIDENRWMFGGLKWNN